MNHKLIITIIALALLLPISVNASWREDQDRVDHILECIDENSDGNYTAYFGYNNENFFPVDIPVGYFNRFRPMPIDRGQTTHFLPGRAVKAFHVTYDGSNLTWVLNERRMTIGNETKPCIERRGSGGNNGGNGGSNDNSFSSTSNDNESVELETESEWNEEEKEDEYEKETSEVPEFSTITAALVLIGAGIYIHRKRKKV